VLRKLEPTKLLQSLELMKVAYNYGGNTRQQSVNVRHHKSYSLDPRKNDFLKLMMLSSRFFHETQDWDQCTALFLRYVQRLYHS
jgi:hypothetical protein